MPQLQDGQVRFHTSVPTKIDDIFYNRATKPHPDAY
jgi:hypothetical protein